MCNYLFLAFLQEESIYRLTLSRCFPVNAFQLKYVNADDIDWELIEGNYHVEFELNNKDFEFWMNEKGKLLRFSA